MSPFPSPLCIPTPPSDEPSSDDSDHNPVLEEIDTEQLTTTVDTLELCTDVENDPDRVATEMVELDFEVLSEATDNLSNALQHVHNPLVDSKDPIIDNLEVAFQNLTLIVEPMFDRRDTTEALTDRQATRYALQTYTPNELIRQRAAILSAHRSLTRVLEHSTTYEPSPTTSSVSSESTSSPTLLDRLVAAFSSRFFPDSDSVEQPPSKPPTSTSSQSSESRSSEPVDFDESDLVWADETHNSSTPSTDPNTRAVDDQDET